jgi:hypothetical protein
MAVAKGRADGRASLVSRDGSLSLTTGMIAGALMIAVVLLARFRAGNVLGQKHRVEK